MTSKKRPRDEAIEDTEELNTHKLLNGLNNIWYNGSIESHNALVEQFRELETIYGSARPRKSKENDPGSMRRSKVLITLHDVATREQERDGAIMYRLPEFEIKPMVLNGSNWTSMLQHRYRQFLQLGSPTGVKSLTQDVRKYYLFLAMQEHEMENGPMDQDYPMTMVGNSCWTPTEKRKFFMAVERCSRGDVAEISRRLGPTKTVAEVGAYLNLLDGAAKAIGGKVRDDSYTAREMSNLFLLQQNRMAAILEAKLETESYAKHQELICQEIAQKSLELFEIWNFSSLTRVFGGISDMTVLSSTLVQYYELLKRFITDILTGVYAEMLDNPDKVVSRPMMNHIIAKRKITWRNLNNKKDVRLKNLDILGMLDGRHRHHKVFSDFRSASFLAKKRRLGWQKTGESVDKEPKEKIIEIDSDDSDHSSDNEDADSDNDDMLKPFDIDDELVGQYISQDDKRQRLFEEAHPELHDTLDVVEEEELGEYFQEDSDEDDEIVEERMQVLDKAHERELIQHLDFHDMDAIFSHSKK